MRYVYLTLLGLAVCAVVSCSVFVIRLADPSRPASSPDAMTEELAAITARHARHWDHQRGDAIDDAHRQEMRARWREAYHADVRECCERHGRPCPAWAAQD